MQPDHRNRVEALLRFFQEHRLDELLVEEADFSLHLRSRRAARPSPPAGASGVPKGAQASGAVANRSSLSTPAAPARRPRTVAVRSPLIGVFYRAAAPEAPPFVEMGDLVEEGHTVGVVEAMKVFNEIKAEWRGRVVAIPAKNGELVQAGQPLVVLAFED